MAGQARAVDGLVAPHRAGHLVVGDLHGTLTGVRHVAVRAGDARLVVDALGEGLEVRVLCLHDVRAGEGVLEVGESDLVVVLQRVVHGQAVVPREGEGLLLTLEVVLDVALRAGVGAHLDGGGVLVHVVVRHTLTGLVLLDPLDERRARDAQVHGLGIVAVDALDGVFRVGGGLLVRHLVHGGEARHHVPVTELVHHGDRAGVAVQAGARLVTFEDAPRGALVEQHVLVAAGLAVVDREGVALPHRDEPGVLLDLADGRELARVLRRGLVGDPLLLRHVVGGLERLVLHGEVLAPDGCVGHRLVHLHHLLEGDVRLGTPFEDVEQEREDSSGDQRPRHEEDGERQPVRSLACLGFHCHHSMCPTVEWHLVHETVWSAGTAAWSMSVMLPWQYRQASSVICRLCSRIRMLSG